MVTQGREARLQTAHATGARTEPGLWSNKMPVRAAGRLRESRVGERSLSPPEEPKGKARPPGEWKVAAGWGEGHALTAGKHQAEGGLRQKGCKLARKNKYYLEQRENVRAHVFAGKVVTYP